MKKILAALLLMTPGLAWAANPVANAADYTVAVHIQASRLVTLCNSGTCHSYEQLQVVIDGKKYELSGDFVPSELLRTGDYVAKIVKDHAERPYEYTRRYQVLFSDGKTRNYTVTGEEE